MLFILQMIQAYRVKAAKLSGTNFREVNHRALCLYQTIKRRTKRRPYVRAAYFKKDKIFLELFWKRLFDKNNWRDRIRREKFFSCGIELIQNTRFNPITKQNPFKPAELWHRFLGVTRHNECFCIQIKEDRKTNEKWLMSIFPED